MGRTDRRRWLRHGLLAAVAALPVALAGPVTDAGALPSGRVDELVSVEHQGFPTGAGPTANASNPAAFIGPGGAYIAYPSFDPFTGASGQQATFESTRSATGWSTVGLYPPLPDANALNGVQTFALSDDGSTAILTTTAPLLPEDTNGVKDVYLVADGVLTLISAGSTTDSNYEGRSADASHILFESKSILVAGATSTAQNLYEWLDGTIRLVGVKPDSTIDARGAVLGRRDADQGFSSSNPVNAVSRDGSQIVFSSPAPTKSVAADRTRVYIRTNGATTVEASASQCTRVAPACSAVANVLYAGASRDGSHVYMTSAQQLTNDDTDAVSDLYDYDVATGQLTRISAGVGADAMPVTESIVLGSSDDGSRVYFRAAGQIVELWNGSSLTSIGVGGDGQTLGSNQRCAPGGGGGAPNVTPDGRYLVFSAGGFVPSDPSGPTGPGVYRYDAVTNAVTQIAPVEGVLPNGFGGSAEEMECVKRTGVSNDGSYVLFTTDVPLVSQDVNGVTDVYQWHDGVLSLISSGTSDQASVLFGTTPDARDVFFAASDPLAPQDQDTVQDVYDARIGGGFPVSAPPGDCTGDGCRGPLGSPPVLPAPGSAAFSGTGNRDERPAPLFIARAVGGAAGKRLAKHGQLALAIDVGAPGRVAATAVARVHGDRAIVASAAKRVGKGRVRLLLTLSRSARKRLSAAGRLTVRITVSYSKAARALESTVTLSK